MAARDSAAGGDQRVGGGGELLEGGVARRHSGARDAAGADHARLQLGKLAEGGLDAVLDCTDLGCNFISGVFDHLFAHDCSFPGAPRAGVAVGLI